MPRTDDHSAGDGREPYADEGGPEAHHAQSHDVRRERATRATGSEPAGEDFDADLHPEHASGHGDEEVLAADDKAARRQVPELDADELKRLPVLTVGTRLDQGSTYLDLNALDDGPFTAMGGQEAGQDDLYVAKRDVDYELWDRLVGTH